MLQSVQWSWRKGWCVCILGLIIGCTPREWGDKTFPDAETDPKFSRCTPHDTQDDFWRVSCDEPAPLEEKAAKPDPIFLQNVTMVVMAPTALGDVLKQLAEQVHATLYITPEVADHVVTFTAYDQPLLDVIEKLCLLSEARYVITGGCISIERDTPYMQHHRMPFLSMSRDAQHHVHISTAIHGRDDHRQGNGSDAALTTTTKSSFWDEVDSNLAILLRAEGSDQDPPRYTLNRHSGVISVHASQAKQRAVQEYVKVIEKSLDVQVLIEAKIIEVELSHEFRSGIDWDSLHKRWALSLNPLESMRSMPMSPTSSRNAFIMGRQGENLGSLVRLLESFGDVRTLSSPRLTIMNNQTALLRVAKNEVFFTVNYQNRAQRTKIDQDKDLILSQISSQMQTIPIGFVMTVQPSIHPETRKITMTLRPSLSRVSHMEMDPAVALMSQDRSIAGKEPIQSKVPVVEIREMDSVLTAQSGEIVMLGGLMQESLAQARAGVPGVSKVPLLGKLFQGRQDQHITTELVIFLKPRIVRSGKPSRV